MINPEIKEECLLIIISFNRLSCTKMCIESIQKNTNYPVNILIIDNDSDSETINYLKKLQNKGEVDVIFNNENKGWIGGVNQGLDYGDYKYYCVMNNDIIVYPHWLEQMIKVSEQDEDTGLVNPEWHVPKRYTNNRDRFIQDFILSQENNSIETDWVRGFCILRISLD